MATSSTEFRFGHTVSGWRLWKQKVAAHPGMAIETSFGTVVEILLRSGVTVYPVNPLQQTLREYYPTALEAFDDQTSPNARAFVEGFPTAAELVLAGKRKSSVARPTPRRCAVSASAG